LPKGSGPCLPCYTRWLASRRSKGDMAEESDRFCRSARAHHGLCARKNAGPLVSDLQISVNCTDSLVSGLQVAFGFGPLLSLRHCDLQLAFEFVDPRGPLAGRLD